MEMDPGFPRPKSIDVNAAGFRHHSKNHHNNHERTTTAMSTTIADSIHPPDIVTLMTHHEEFESGNGLSAVPSFPDSPLSSPPDSPRSDVSGADALDVQQQQQPLLQLDDSKDAEEILSVGAIPILRKIDKNKTGAPFDEHEDGAQKLELIMPRSSSTSSKMNMNGVVMTGNGSTSSLTQDAHRQQQQQQQHVSKGDAGDDNDDGSDVPDDEKKVDESFYSTGANTSGPPVWGEDEEWMEEQEGKTTGDEMEEPGRIIHRNSTGNSPAPTAGARAGTSNRSKDKRDHQYVVDSIGGDDGDGIAAVAVAADLTEPPSLTPKLVGSNMSVPSMNQIRSVRSATGKSSAAQAMELSSLSIQMQSIISKYASTTQPRPSNPQANATRHDAEVSGEQSPEKEMVPCSTIFEDNAKPTATASQQREMEPQVVIDQSADITAGDTDTDRHKVGDDENFELSVMVLPDGQIDSLNPIISVSSSSHHLEDIATNNEFQHDEGGFSHEELSLKVRESAEKKRTEEVVHRSNSDDFSHVQGDVVGKTCFVSHEAASRPAANNLTLLNKSNAVDDKCNFSIDLVDSNRLLGTERQPIPVDIDDRSEHIEPIGNVDLGKTPEDKSSFREMTPNRDLNSSEKSAGWLQEELRRRAFVKMEINKAIVSRGNAVGDEDDNDDGVQGPIEVSVESFDRLRDSHSVTDDEVAAITAEEVGRNGPANSREYASVVPASACLHDPVPRMLDFDSVNESEDGPISELLTSSEETIQAEMRKFAMETRNFLREQSFSESKEAPLESGITVNPSMDAEARQEPAQFDLDAQNGTLKMPAPNASRSGGSSGDDFVDLQENEAPVMVESLDSFNGIAKGDIMLSLLSENTGSEETGATWGLRVHSAIWRARRMRRSFVHGSGNLSRGRSSLPVDTDYSRVVGGFRTISSTEEAAIAHLEHDEINEAIELVEDIIFAYYSYFEKSLSSREENPDKAGIGIVDFKPYIGAALHNLGILNLLRGEYSEALSYFSRSVENRKSQHGDGHPNHVSSLVKLAVCQYALNEFAAAHAALEEALFHARRTSNTLEDRVQVAEILNNLGCLAYMCGQPAAANAFYRDSMDVQFRALSDSLYTGSPILGQSISLNISITRANIGFIKLVTKDLSVSITALENALMEQQILLMGAHETIIATMDHLAVARLLNGDQEQASLMFHRILSLQQSEYGERDRRCQVTRDKIKMVQSQGIQYAVAIKELSNTFAMPRESVPTNQPTEKALSPAASQRTNPKRSQKKKNKTKWLSLR